MQIDPLAAKYDSWSPYHFAFNDPVFWSDPSGADSRGNYWWRYSLNSSNQREYQEGAMYSMYGVAWNDATYGGYSGAGGATAAFSRIAGSGSWEKVYYLYLKREEEYRTVWGIDWIYNFVPAQATGPDDEGMFRRAVPGEDLSELAYLELRGHFDIGAQFESFNTVTRLAFKMEAAAFRIVQVNYRFYFDHNNKQIIFDPLGGSSLLALEIAKQNVQIFSTGGLGYGIGGETAQVRTLSEFLGMFKSIAGLRNFLAEDESRDTWNFGISVLNYVGGRAPTLSLTYSDTRSIIGGYEGTISINVPTKLLLSILRP